MHIRRSIACAWAIAGCVGGLTAPACSSSNAGSAPPDDAAPDEVDAAGSDVLGGDAPDGDATRGPPVLLPMDNALTGAALGVIVNVDDPASMALGSYYLQKRKIPAANLISVHIPTGATITSAQFAPVKMAVDAAASPNIQAYALAFTQPYAVDCMSITSAFAFGFDTKWCNPSSTCDPGAQSPYFGGNDPAPYTHLGLRPTMMLAGASMSDATKLVDRGVAADDTYPKGTAYLVITSDPARSVRGPEFQALAGSWDPATGIHCLVQDNSQGGSSDVISGKTDVLFYFTGLADVPQITTNTYLPGAVADHLTSFGGQVPTSGQMSAEAWLQAGATGSFGTVTEPCNYTEKFPDPSLLVPRYFQGGTLLEAYWKSVQWPGEGLFIGEPLSAPWRSPIVTFAGGTLTIKTSALAPGVAYRLEGAGAPAGPFSLVQGSISTAKYDYVTLTVPNASYAYYRIVPEVDAGGG